MSQPAPKKSLGQHFLHNRAICQRIVNLLEPQEEDQILEIGPGPGALTSLLLQAPRKELVAIEKDDYWATERRKDGVTVLTMDALAFDWAGLCADGNWKLIGNLPYNIASPLIWDILGQCRCWQRAVFMVQKEVGSRIVAAPNSRAYGALSVWCQCHAKVKMCFNIGPGAFNPPPKVDSAVLMFEPLATMPQYPEQLYKILKICFQQRRKQLGGIFRKSPVSQEALKELGLDAKARPENLTCADYLNLAEWMEKN